MSEKMNFHLYKVSGYEEAIMSLRMSHGKFYSWEKAQEIQQLVYLVTNECGFLNEEWQYDNKLDTIDWHNNPKISGDYSTDIEEFKRLLGLTKNNAMRNFDHHTLMKYIDVSFFTDGLHRGAQDDLDAHAMGFNNRITRFSTRLAIIEEQKVSDWYQDKIIPFHDAIQLIGDSLPQEIEHNGEIFKYTPFGYVLQRYEEMAHNNGLRKDVMRGLMGLATPGCAIWKSDIFNLRYIYSRRSKLTKANPELRIGMEQLADQIEQHIPVFGEHFRYQYTDTGKWEHLNKVRTVTSEEYKILQNILEKEVK